MATYTGVQFFRGHGVYYSDLFPQAGKLQMKSRSPKFP